MKEVWKAVKGYEWYYEISDLWVVRRINNPKNKSVNNYIIKQSLDNSWYKSVLLSVDWYKKRFLVHRLVAINFVDNPEWKKTVNHKDFNKTNNNKENLEWLTQSENCKHAIKQWRMPNNKWSKHWMSKLTEKEVLEIREKCKKQTGASLAREYKVWEQAIYDIKNWRRWKHLWENCLLNKSK